LVLVQEAVAQDVSAYTTKEFIFTKPNGEALTKAAQFETDGEDGVLTYVVANGDINQVGMWEARARIGKAGARLTSEKLTFLVVE
jgi:hypothetical protein